MQGPAPGSRRRVNIVSVRPLNVARPLNIVLPLNVAPIAPPLRLALPPTSRPTPVAEYRHHLPLVHDGCHSLLGRTCSMLYARKVWP